MALSSFVLIVLAVSVHVCTSKPYDIAVNDITAESAVVFWKTTEKATNIERFKVYCNGTRHYVSTNGQKLLDIYEKIQYAPSGKDHVFIADLQANVNYTCTIWEHIGDETQVLHGEVSEPFQFVTDYGAPEEPLTPVIQKNPNNHSISILLFSTSTRFGPISGYQVQFHLVESKINENLPLTDDDLFEPFSPFSPLISKNEAQTSTKAKSFWIDFKSEVLPNNILIDESLLSGALKGGTEYIVVIVPYTLHNKLNETTMLFTPSNMSAIFGTYSLTLNPARLNTNECADLVLAIILGIVIPVSVLIYLFCFGTIVYCVLRRRKKKKEKKHSRRDLVEKSTRARAEEQGDELPWYHQQTAEDTHADQTTLNSSSSRKIMASSSASPSYGHQESGQQFELQAMAKDNHQSPFNEQRSPTTGQDNQLLLTSPVVVESAIIICDKQLLTVPSVSEESWLTPNTSLSNSLITEHAPLIQASEVEDNDHIVTKCVSANSVMTYSRFDATQQPSNVPDVCSISEGGMSSCLSSEMIDVTNEEGKLCPNIIITDLFKTSDSSLGIDEGLKNESLSDESIQQGEEVHITEESSGDLHRRFEIVSDLGNEILLSDSDMKEPQLDGTHEFVHHNVQLKREMSANKEVLKEVSCSRECVDSCIQFGKEVSVIEEPQAENEDHNVKYKGETSATEEALTEGNLECVNNCIEFGEEVSVIEEPQVEEEMIENLNSDIIKKDISKRDEELSVGIHSSRHGTREGESVIEEDLPKEILEHTDGRIDLNDEASLVKEYHIDVVLECVESSIDLGEEVSDIDHEEHQMEGMFEKVDNSIDFMEAKDEPLTDRRLERMDSSNDFMEDVLDMKTLHLVEGTLEHPDSEVSLNVEVSKEYLTDVIDGELKRANSSTDLREEVSDIDREEHQTEGMLVCVNSSIDFMEAKDEPLTDTRLEQLDSSNDFMEEILDTKDPYLVEGMLEYPDSEINLNEEVSEDYLTNVTDLSEEVSDFGELLKEEAIQRIDNSDIHVREEVSLLKEPGKLEPVDSSIDLRENVSIVEEPAKQMLERVDSSIDLREETSMMQEYPLNEMLVPVNISCDLREEYPVVVKSVPGSMLTRVEGSIDLREEDSKEPPQMGRMIKHANSNIDLREEFSITEFEKDEVDFNTLSNDDEDVQIEDTSVTSDSDSLYARAKPLDLHGNTQIDNGATDNNVENKNKPLKEETSDSVRVGNDQRQSNVQNGRPLKVVESMGDHVCINIEPNDEKSHLVDDQSTSKVIVALNPPTSQRLSKGHSPPQNLASSSFHRSLSQFNLPRSSSSLPGMLQIEQSHHYSLHPSKSVGSEVNDRSQLNPPTGTSNTKSEIYDAQSIQLSRVSNQSRSTSSGNYSLTSQIFKHSISGSGSDLSGHYRPPSAAKSGVQHSSIMTSNQSRSSDSHSLTSHQYKYSDNSGSSDVIFTKTGESQRPVEASFNDKQIISTHGSISESSDVFKDETETNIKDSLEPCAIDVFTVSVDHSVENSSQVGSSKLGQSSQESVCLYHSKPTLNLTDEHSHEVYPPKVSVLKASSDFVDIQLEESGTVVEVRRERDIDISIDHPSGQPLKVSPKLSSNSGIQKSQGHIIVAMDSDGIVDANDTLRLTLSNTNTTGSSSELSHCSTEYYTAQEFSSESSMGMLCSTAGARTRNVEQSDVLSSSGSGSEHRDANQLSEEPTVVCEKNNLLKMSNSASLFIPRGFSTGPQDRSAMNISQGHGSTCTLASILAQLSESSVSEEDQQTGGVPKPDQTVRVYEPY